MMRKTILLLALALMGVTTGFAEEADTIRVYKINGQRCKAFDGSQLVGKTIKTYEVSSVPFSDVPDGTKHVLQVHEIYTTDCPDSQLRENQPKPLYIVDGEEFAGGLDALSPSDIKSIDVIKDPKVCAAYGPKASAGVVRIVTKKMEADPIVYLLDGQVTDSVSVKRLAPSDIKEIRIFKAGSPEAVKYGTGVSVCRISTK